MAATAAATTTTATTATTATTVALRAGMVGKGGGTLGYERPSVLEKADLCWNIIGIVALIYRTARKNKVLHGQ